MSNRSPVFPIPDSQHFSDYGFDPQFNYCQVMEEARKHKRETSSKSSIINSLHFKIQKPISKDDPTRSTMHHNKRKKRWWWKKALSLFKWRKWPISTVAVNDRKVRNFRSVTGSMSSPVYSIESRTGSNTTYRRPSSGPIAGTLTTARKGDVAFPYLSLRELNMEQQQRISISSSPIYLVT